MVTECRCDCVSCVTGNHQGCYYWPRELCCPFPRVQERPLINGEQGATLANPGFNQV